jgi:hypothetical protein
MNIRRQIRMQILAGLGALVLLTAVRARAIEDDGARQAASQQSLAANGDFTSENAMAGMSITGPTTAAEAELGRAMVTDAIVLAILLAGMILIVAYTSVATRRRQELRPVLGGRVRGISYRPAGAANH